MKKASKFSPVLLLFALLLTTAHAEENVPSTPIRVSSSAVVCCLDAGYIITDAEVASVDVVFAPGMFAEYYYENGRLNIAVASAYPVDTSVPLAQVTAVLTDGTKIAPQMELVEILINGEDSIDELRINDISAVLCVNAVNVTVTAGDAIGNSYLLIVAGYKDNGQMTAITKSEISFSSDEQKFAVNLPNGTDIRQVGIFLLNDDYSPAVGMQKCSVIQQK